jgi:hypothetical protein
VIGCLIAALARRRGRPYLNVMAQPLSSQQEMIAISRPWSGAKSAMIWGGAGLAAAILLGTAVLWFHYGTAVFVEMVASGISACF